MGLFIIIINILIIILHNVSGEHLYHHAVIFLHPSQGGKDPHLGDDTHPPFFLF